MFGVLLYLVFDSYIGRCFGFLVDVRVLRCFGCFLRHAFQVVIAMLITLAGLRVLSGLRPYRQGDENNLAEASLWVTFLTL